MRLLLSLIILSTSIFALDASNKKEAIRSIAVILEIDKTKDQYKEILGKVDLYPKIDWINFNKAANTKYHQFVKELLPYLLQKVKYDDLSTQERSFSKLIFNAKKINKSVYLSPSEEAIYSFVAEKLRLDKELKSCATLKAQYKGQEELMNAQLQRVDLDDDEFLVKELSNVTGRIHYISSGFNK